MKLFFLFFSFACALASNAQDAVFNITYNGFTPQAQAAYQYAANQWSQMLNSPVPIKVNAHFTTLIPGLLGITLPNGRKNFIGAPLQNTWYATSLANALAGTELNPGEADLDMYINSGIAWSYDTTGVTPSSQYDLSAVVIHELCHGLGFLSLAKKSGTIGSFGLLLASDFAPLTTSFPWPNLDTLPSAYDRLLVNNLGQRLDSLPNPGTTLGTALTNNNVYLDGPFTLAANNGMRPKAYAPSAFALGSSISHLDESTYPNGNVNEMMTPTGAPGTASHNPGPITLGVLRDMGWNLNPLYVNEIKPTNALRIYPNPVSDALTVARSQETSDGSLQIKDVTGKLVMTKSFTSGQPVDLSLLHAGYYFVTLESRRMIYRAAFVKQ